MHNWQLHNQLREFLQQVGKLQYQQVLEVKELVQVLDQLMVVKRGHKKLEAH